MYRTNLLRDHRSLLSSFQTVGAGFPFYYTVPRKSVLVCLYLQEIQILVYWRWNRYRWRCRAGTAIASSIAVHEDTVSPCNVVHK